MRRTKIREGCKSRQVAGHQSACSFGRAVLIGYDRTASDGRHVLRSDFGVEVFAGARTI